MTALWSTAFVGSTPIGATIIGAIGAACPRLALLVGAGACGAAAMTGYVLLAGSSRHIELEDTADGPMLAAPIMSALVLGSVLSAHAQTAGHVVVIVFLILGALLCGLLIGEWMTGGVDRDRVGPAMYLPGGGIGFVGSESAYAIGAHGVAALFFGIGVFTWVFASSIVLSRLQYWPRLAPALVPTMAIELGPPAVAGSAYFLLRPGPPTCSPTASPGTP